MTLNYIKWDVDPEIINLFGFSLRYYGLLFIGGIILCSQVLKRMFVKENIPVSYLDKLVIYGILGIAIGARLVHCLFYEPSYYLNHPIEIFLPIQLGPEGSYEVVGFKGLASHGGTFGLIIAVIIYSRQTKQSIIKTIDLIGVVAPLGACFIRLANLMNSEIVGTVTNVPWAFIFTSEDNQPRHPAQLYEAITYIGIFGLLYYLYNTKREKLQSGFFFGCSLALIFVARFFIEFVKERQVAFEEQMTLDMGQILSIPFIVTGIGFMIYGYRKSSKA